MSLKNSNRLPTIAEMFALRLASNLIDLLIKNEFLQEADEIVADLDLFFLDFERSPNDLSNIDRIFRLMHTLKGSGMAAGFTQLGEFALGGYDFIDKPFTHERLTQSASNALRLKVMRDGVDELSRLNFRAYLLNSKLVDHLPSNDQVDQKILAEITSCLDRISSLTRHILGDPDTVFDASRDPQS